MPFDLINFVAAQAILRNRNVSSDTLTRSSLAAALVPGPFGLALPLVAARGAPPPVVATGGDQGSGSGKTTEYTTVPGLVGLTEADASKNLKAAGLSFAIVRDFHRTVEKDRVFAVSPPAGETLLVDSTVKLSISDGPKTECDSNLQKEIQQAQEHMINAIADRVVEKLSPAPGAATGKGSGIAASTAGGKTPAP